MTRSALLSAAGITLVLLIATGLRLGAASGSVVVDPLRADAREYFLYAYNLRYQGVYSHSDAALAEPPSLPIADAARSPGYPLFLAPFVDGPPRQMMLRRVVIAQAALGVLTVLLCWAACRRWMPAPAAVAAALLTALSPHLVNASLYVLTEALFTLLLVAALWLGGRDLTTGRGSNGLLFGLVLGAANLVRPSLTLFGPLAALIVLAHFGKERGWRVALLVMAGFIAIQTPWMLRNLDEELDTGGPQVLLATALAGIYPNLMYKDEPASYGYAYRFDPNAELYKRDSGALLGEVARRFHDEPARHLRWFLVVKPLVLWSWNIIQGQGGAFVYEMARSPYYDRPAFVWSYRLMEWLHWPLVLLGGAGTVLAWLPATRRAMTPGALLAVRLTSALLLYFVALHTLLAPYPRYSVPLRPALYAMAMFTLWSALHAGRRLIRR